MTENRVRHCAGPDGCDVKWIGGPTCWSCGRVVTRGLAWGTILINGGAATWTSGLIDATP